MLLIVQKDIRVINLLISWFNAIHSYWKANNKYMKDYANSKESSHLKYLDVNGLYGWTISQKSSVDGFN